MAAYQTHKQKKVRAVTAILLTEFCHDVCVQPDLQPVTSNQLDGATANWQDGARIDISDRGDWDGRFEKMYFDMRILNPHALLTETRHVKGTPMGKGKGLRTTRIPEVTKNWNRKLPV